MYRIDYLLNGRTFYTRHDSISDIPIHEQWFKERIKLFQRILNLTCTDLQVPHVKLPETLKTTLNEDLQMYCVHLGVPDNIPPLVLHIYASNCNKYKDDLERPI